MLNLVPVNGGGCGGAFNRDLIEIFVSAVQGRGNAKRNVSVPFLILPLWNGWN